MKKFGFVVGFLAVLPVCLAGQKKKDDEPALIPPLISYGTFPLPLVRTYVITRPGKPTDKAEMNSPFPDDFPPCVEVDLEDARVYKIPEGSYSFPSINALRVFRIGDLKAAPYETIQSHIKRLQKLLKDRPAAFQYDNKTAANLPDYPSRNAAQAFNLHIRYVDAKWGSGIGYMTVFTQDGSNHAGNDELQYIFQGLSKDGQYYIAADFRVTHPKLQKFNPNVEKGDYAPDVKLLEPLKENSFTPEIGKIVKWLETLKIGEQK